VDSVPSGEPICSLAFDPSLAPQHDGVPMHIGQFVLSWTANLSFSRDEQIPHLSASLAERVTIQDPAQSPRPADLLTAAASTPVIAVLPFAVSAQPPIEPALMDC
jgi:hypothetical protein